MYIYKINLIEKVLEETSYDYYEGAVIIAKNERQCRTIANKNLGGDEQFIFKNKSGKYINKSKTSLLERNKKIWLSDEYSQCTNIGIANAKKQGVVLESFHAG